MSQITTHILDTTRGRPVEGVTIILFQQHPEEWRELSIGTTNKDGRVTDLLKKGAVLEFGVYKLRFEIQSYFETQATLSFYPFIEIVFNIDSEEYYHVPLLLNPFGYSTYRGS